MIKALLALLVLFGIMSVASSDESCRCGGVGAIIVATEQPVDCPVCANGAVKKERSVFFGLICIGHKWVPCSYCAGNGSISQQFYRMEFCRAKNCPSKVIDKNIEEIRAYVTRLDEEIGRRKQQMVLFFDRCIKAIEENCFKELVRLLGRETLVYALGSEVKLRSLEAIDKMLNEGN